MCLSLLPDFPLDERTDLGGRFAALGLRGYHDAARYVWRLPYGRTADRSDYRLVLEEGRGTCSTKHALLAGLARDHGRPVNLVLGIYEMDGDNTPGVGPVLRRHGLGAVPEAHCYLAHRGAGIDLTHNDRVAEPTVSFLWVEKIEPDQIGGYKVERHRRFVRGWAEERGLDFEFVWRVREECIVALAGHGGRRESLWAERR